MTTRIHTALLSSLLVLTGGLTAARAQPSGAPCPGRGASTAYGPYQGAFDPKAIETVEGTIAAVDRTVFRGMWPGVHLRLKTAKQTVEVHLGPAWFVDSGEMTLAAGDKVQIQGSRAKVQGNPVLIAMTLSKGEMTLRLRDADGFPYWAGWRRRLARPAATAHGHGPR